jgi:hypothetical protein
MLFDASLREHVALSVETLKAVLLKTPDLEALQDALEENSTTVAEAVEIGYPGTHDDFLELWRSHTGYYSQYLRATMHDDEATREDVKEKLSTFTEETANLLSDASPHLDPDDAQEALSAHTDRITTVIDEFAEAEYDDAYAAVHEAYEHIGMAAELLARFASTRQTQGII